MIPSPFYGDLYLAFQRNSEGVAVDTLPAHMGTAPPAPSPRGWCSLGYRANRLHQSQGGVSEVLRGKRELNIQQIRALVERFQVSPAVFI